MQINKIIAVAVDEGSGLDALVSGHFGQCSGFVLVDVEGDAIVGSRWGANPLAGEHVPGAMPKLVRGFGANVVLVGGMGPPARTALQRWGIDVATGARGSVRDVVNAYLRGDLRGFEPCKHEHEHDCGSHH